MAVAGDTGDTEYLAAPDFEIDVPRRLDAAATKILEHQTGRAEAPIRGTTAPLDPLADHRLDELVVAPIANRGLIDQFAAPHDRHPVGAGADIGELVGDDDDRTALFREPPHQAMQATGLLRRQHRRRLIEDDQARVEIKDLGEFDQLSLTDREVADQGPRGDLGGKRPKPGHDRLVLPARSPLADVRPGEKQIFQDTERRQQAELLEHHPDAERHRVARRGDRRSPSVDLDRPRIGRQEAVDELHQRRLAGSILPEQGEHFARRDVEVDVVIGDEIAKAPGQALEPDQGRGHDLSRNTASTSTAAHRGRLATPTAVRQCSPLSPNTSIIRSEAPLTTKGTLSKFGTQLTKPPSRTQ